MRIKFDAVLLVGDTHADWTWLEYVVLPIAALLGLPAIIVLGDFGYWARRPEFLQIAATSRANHGVDVFFIDGNHEQHPLLKTDCAKASRGHAFGPVNLTGSLWYLPRGSRLEVAQLEVAALGGAVSIDRFSRKEDDSWFEAEAATDADVARLIAGGPADVLLTHDAPSGWQPPDTRANHMLLLDRQIQLPAIADHRRRLRRGYEALQPKLLVHGHYHVGYDEYVGESWGDVRVLGLSANGSEKSLRILSSNTSGPVLSDWIDPWAHFPDHS